MEIALRLGFNLMAVMLAFENELEYWNSDFSVSWHFSRSCLIGDMNKILYG